MRKYIEFRTTFCCCLVLLLACLTTSLPSLGQNPGNNVVQGSGVTTSTAYIDASVIAGTSGAGDICALINAALGLIGTAGGSGTRGYGTSTVIDARGIPQPGSSQTLTCPSTYTPWSYGNTRTQSATILLPAGNITIGASWVLPTGTHLVGEGSGSVAGGTTITTIQTTSALNPMIQMGATASSTAVSIEDLDLNGEGDASVGILNSDSMEQSYVKRVGIYQIVGKGLSVTSGASYSGPYSEITFGNGSSTVSASTACVSINSVSTRGVHGLHCTNTGSIPSAGAAVLLNGPSNSLTDVTIQGFYDGVEIGSNASETNVKGNVLRNISATPWTTTPTVKHSVVRIMSTSGVAIGDDVVMGVNKGGTGTTSYSIEDDATAQGSAGATTLLTDTTVALYAIGEVATVTHAVHAYPRFSTSPNLPTWVRGAVTPGSSCVVGSLYSNTAGTGGTPPSANDLYVCTATNTWTDID